MPRRTDIHKILLIGSGPIIIGQGCEFDYSGTQACKALREDGYEVVLINSNPATIMTDPDMADRTYIEPLTPDIVHEIIRRERPDALLPTLGGQTALNLAMELEESGILKRYNVELIGASAAAIRRAEDRQLFKETMNGLGLDMPRSGSAHTLPEAEAVAGTIGSWPLIIRPGFTLGGTGGGIAHTPEEFADIVRRGLDASLNSEVLIEESLLGWKEFEMEVMTDSAGNSVIVCSIENLDPMGVHTGDSITIAPIQTLSDAEYQAMRDDSLRVLKAIGVQTGGSNVQWAVHPETGRRIIIEMNPRVSRSSALASKATGFPIAKIAALLAVGYNLPELKNDITGHTPSCFEPALDYVVTKIPRFTFEKFPNADSSLGTQMKSVGEVMAIGRNLKQSLQKALRSLETGRFGFGADGKDATYEQSTDMQLQSELTRPNDGRIFYIRAAFRRGWSVQRVQELTGIDSYFLRHLAELAAFEDELVSAGTLSGLEADIPLFRQAKELGYSDRQIAHLLNCSELDVQSARKRINLQPGYAAVDTCAGEFEALTPYYYSTYNTQGEAPRVSPGKKSIMIIGGGPNRIGQGIEFDYCCCQAAAALRQAGYEVVMVNSNPETVSTDYDTSDKLYFEPLTLEDLLPIYKREQCCGAIVQFGGQTPLNLAQQLKDAGVNIIGTSPEHIALAEDRDYFRNLAKEIGIRQPDNGIACTVDEALSVARRIGYPVLVRPSYVLGGRGMVIVYKESELRYFAEQAAVVSEGTPILIDRFLENAVELDVDCISDGKITVIGGILEHVEPAGIHSGDSASVLPPVTLSPELQDKVRTFAHAFSKALHICGLMNMQLAVKDGELYMIEVNPRASRTVPFVSKAIGRSLAGLAALCMVGAKLEQLGFTEEIKLPYYAVKEAVFPFIKFPGADVMLSPEMKSTGEVMSIDRDWGLAYLKSQMAAGTELPDSGSVFMSVRDSDKELFVPLAATLQRYGFTIYATIGTSTMLYNAGIKTRAVYRISCGRPNVLDLIRDREINWIINTSESGTSPMLDETQMRSQAVAAGIPITTTASGAVAAISGLEEKMSFGRYEVYSIQEYHRHLIPTTNKQNCTPTTSQQ